MIGRVNRVNFTGIYGGRVLWGGNGPTARRVYVERLYAVPAFHLAGRDPEELLEKSLPSALNLAYKGGCLADETIQKLRDAGVSIEVINHELQDKQEAGAHGLSG